MRRIQRFPFTALTMEKKHLFVQKWIKQPPANKHAPRTCEKKSNSGNFPNAICIRVA